MSHEDNPKNLNLSDLAHNCAEETELFFQHRDHDTRYCFELFRRAIRENNQFAWETIFNQYESLVTGWVKQHRGFEASGEEAQFFVTGAFAKISSNLTSEKFTKFSDLQSVLYYLKMCVHSVITDFNRVAGSAFQQVSLDELQSNVKENSPATEEIVLDRFDNQALWDQLTERLNDEKERLVMQGVFILALKPRELCDHYAGKFSDVEEVYRIKQNVLARLRRDAEFRKLLGEND
jgi:hypothetical protein